MGSPPAQQWPAWPAGQQGFPILDIEVEKSIDDLFLLLHGGHNDFRASLIETCNYKEFVSTGWCSNEAEALEAPATAMVPQPAQLSEIGLKPNMACRTSFLAPSMGSMCLTTELCRVVEYEPGRRIVLEATVQSAVTYGDKFRPVTRRVLETIDENRVRLRHSATLVFIASINGITKSLIQKGARDGMTKAIHAMREELRKHADVRVYGSSTMTESINTVRSAVSATPPAHSAVQASATAAHYDFAAIFGSVLVKALRPWAAFLQAAVGHFPLLQGLTTDTVMLILLGACAFWGLTLGLAALRFIESAGKNPTDLLSLAAHYALRYVRIPSGVHDVACGVGFALAVRWVVNIAAGALPPPPSGQQRRGMSTMGSSPTSETLESRAASQEEEGPRSGIQYDGYSQAIREAADKQYIGGKSSLKLAISTIDKRSEVALEQIRRGLAMISQPFGSPHTTDDAVDTPGGGPFHHHRHFGKRHHHKHRHPPDSVHHEEGQQKEEATGQEETSTNDGGSPSSIGQNGPENEGSLKSSESPRSEHGASIDVAHILERHALGAEAYSGPELRGPHRHDVVVEEIYENERFQPFRGWGHNWPGHFLPTDRVAHWSIRDHTGLDVLYGQDIDQVAPSLATGWRWLEPEWRVDLSGILSESTDDEGWSYGLDFPWVVHPYTPGAGKKGMADFVRRRRWLRTRVREYVDDRTAEESELPTSSAHIDDHEKKEGNIRIESEGMPTDIVEADTPVPTENEAAQGDSIPEEETEPGANINENKNTVVDKEVLVENEQELESEEGAVTAELTQKETTPLLPSHPVVEEGDTSVLTESNNDALEDFDTPGAQAAGSRHA